MYCKNCGRQLDDNMNFCVYCGCNLSENAGKTVMYTVIQVKLLEMQVMNMITHTVMQIKMYRLRNRIKIFLYLGIKLKVVLL